MEYKNAEIEILRNYYDIFAILEASENTFSVWDYMEFSEKRFWWLICWQLSSSRIEIAEKLFEEYDIVDLFEKFAIKLTSEYNPKVEDG